MDEPGVCRLCLVDLQGQAQSLLDPHYLMMLDSMSAIQVNNNSNLSTVACTQCLENLEFCYAFRQNIINSDQIYREHIDDEVKDMSIKEIVNEEMPVEPPTDSINDDNLCQPPMPIKGEDIEVDVCGLDECSDEITLIVECHDVGANHSEYVTVSNSTSNPKSSMSLQEVQSDKVRRHTSSKDVHKCPDCNITVGDARAYQKHMEDNHNQDASSVFKCLHCPSKFEYKALLDAHMKAHEKYNGIKIEQPKPKTTKAPRKSQSGRKRAPLDTRNVECGICSAKVRAYRIRSHMEIHTTGPQMCDLCGAVLRNKSSWRAHITHSHRTKQFCCDECGKVFKEQSFLSLHIKKKHTNERDFACDLCAKRFYEQSAVNDHVRRVHLKLFRFKCDRCTKAFYSSHELTVHMRHHNNETPYKCDMCDEGFKFNLSLKKHRRITHKIFEEKTVPCNKCDMMFGSEHALITHLRSHAE